MIFELLPYYLQSIILKYNAVDLKNFTEICFKIFHLKSI